MSITPTVVVVCGPTAVGKTAVAIQLAQHFNTAIISADSRQCYREMNIGVAKPSRHELSLVHHYFINSHSVNDEVNAAAFETYALDAAEKIFKNNPVAIMVGGTGLYIKAFTQGIDSIPAIHPQIRQHIIDQYNLHGIRYLQEKLQQADPGFWAVAEQQNPQRLMRALEVLEATGHSITTFRTGNQQIRPFKIFKVGLELPRPQLYQRINLRVDEMMEAGLQEEVKNLQPYRHLNALQTVGYSELFPVLAGNKPLAEAVEEIKKHTRHYAKRQMTWFKKDPDITWLDAGRADLLTAILQLV